MKVRKSLALVSCGVALVLSFTWLPVSSAELRDCTALSDDAFRAVLLALDDSDSAVAGNALEALIPEGARALEPLVERVRTRNGKDRALAIRSLGRLGRAGQTAVSVLLDELRNRRSGHGAELVLTIRDLGGDDARAAVPLFVTLLDDPDLKDEAASAVARLSRSHPDQVIPTLVEVLRKQSGSEDLRLDADKDLALYGDLAIPACVELLSDRSVSPLFSLYALRELGPAAMKTAIPYLLAMLDEHGPRTLQATDWLLDLAAIAPDAAAAIYRSFLSDAPDKSQLDAVAGLMRVGRTSDPRIKDVLNALEDDGQVDVRDRARALLAKLGE